MAHHAGPTTAHHITIITRVQINYAISSKLAINKNCFNSHWKVLSHVLISSYFMHAQFSFLFSPIHFWVGYFSSNTEIKHYSHRIASPTENNWASTTDEPQHFVALLLTCLHGVSQFGLASYPCFYSGDGRAGCPGVLFFGETSLI